MVPSMRSARAPCGACSIPQPASGWIWPAWIRARRTGLLRDTFGFHPLAVQDAEHFGQRPKIDAYDDVTLMVVYGATGRGRLVEVHCLYTENYLVTVHRDACPELTALAARLKQLAEPRPDHVMLLYLVVNTLIDGYFPVLADLDDQIDELEDAILQRPTDQQLGAAVRHEAVADRAAQGGRPAAGHVRDTGERRRRAARHDPGRRALLPCPV
jgi:Mg2+ and Co2+ transporter CorA